MVEGNRTLVLVAVVGLGLVAIRSERDALLLVAALAAGTAVVAGVVVLRMLSGDPGDLFLGGRLNQPLDYINAQATVFIIGLWLCFAAVERRQPLLAGAGAGLATLMACLVMLSQSRGAAIAVAASVLMALLVVPGRMRRAHALLLIAAGVALAAGPLQDVYSAGQAREGIGAAAQDAMRSALLASLLVGVAWAAIAAAREAALRAGHGVQVRRAGAGVLVVAAAVALAVGVTNGGRAADGLADQYRAFVHLSEPTASSSPGAATSRLLSGAGNRYDYWRVAWSAFEDAPVGGVGAGNYDRPYFAGRTTTEDIRQPHSIELQALSETGVIGALLLLVFVAGLGLGAWRAAAAARESDLARATTVAAVGGLTAWFVHTSADWMHLLPGLTGVALLLGAVLLRSRDPAPAAASPRPATGRAAQLAVAGGLGLAIVLAGASLSRQGLSEYFQHRARSALPSAPPARSSTRIARCGWIARRSRPTTRRRPRRRASIAGPPPSAPCSRRRPRSRATS